MEFDAVILAGGRSSRLGGVPKARLAFDGASLLERSLLAARGARRTVVVGPVREELPAGVLYSREDPPFSGPAAALAAGLAALAAPEDGGPELSHAPLTLVLACDMPLVAGAVAALLAAGPSNCAASDGAVAVSADGRTQPLVGLYGTSALQRVVDDAARRGALVGGSMFGLLASLELRSVPVPSGSTDDVDTWDDADALGIARPGTGEPGDARQQTT
ncbi:MAG TPA: NTP transferase domain-containing protein [Arthrobacter sp.]|nr:NTP transferase domain-containing protein [Arthrobacter sp.]